MLTIICGIPGAGKTSYMAYLATQHMLDPSSFFQYKKELKVLNNSGFSLAIPPQKHMCFCDTAIHYGRRLATYDIDGFKIGLYNNFFDTVFIPPYSTIFLDEAQRYYDSRMSKYLRDDVYRWYQLHRHNDYNVYLVAQRPNNIDVNIRALVQQVLFIEETKVETNEYGVVTKVIWKGRIFNSADSAENYLVASDKNTVANTGQLFQDECDYNIFACYNSKSCRPAFYSGHYYTKIDYYTETGYSITLESYVEYNNTHYFTAPQGFWKNPERDKEILKQKERNIYANK